MVYKWADGYRAKIKAQAAGERIETLRNLRGGSLNPENILDDAKDESSPLHAAFEWDDAAAAHKHRMQQATNMLISIVVTVEESPKSEPVRAFVNVVDAKRDSVYTSIQNAMRTPEMRDQVLSRAKSELVSWRRRYAQYQELAQVFEVIDTAVVQQQAA